MINQNMINEYSTKEKVVGKWIDGRPIYRRAFSGKTSSDGDSVILTKDINGNKAMIVNCGGTLTQPGNNKFRMNIGGYINTNWYSAMYLSEESVIIYYANNLRNAEYIAFIDYIYI